MSHRRNIPQHPLASPRRITQTWQKKPKCGKRRYTNEIDAKLEVMRFQTIDDPGRSKIPCRAYLCPNCNGWHLTSVPLAEPKKSDVCTKVPFPSEERALERLEEIREDPHTEVIPVRAYFCRKCERWHLTSKPPMKARGECGHVGWLYEDRAWKALEDIKARPRPGFSVPIGIYLCDICERWHFIHGA